MKKKKINFILSNLIFSEISRKDICYYQNFSKEMIYRKHKEAMYELSHCFSQTRLQCWRKRKEML